MISARMDLTVAAGARRSERQVGIEVRHGAVRRELIAPGLLNLRPIDSPQRLAHGVQALEDGEGLLGCPVQRHDGRRRRCCR